MAVVPPPPESSRQWQDENGATVDPNTARMQLQDGLETLLDAVWKAERNWDFDNKIDLGRRSADRHRCGPFPDKGRVFNCTCGLHWERAWADATGDYTWFPVDLKEEE